MRPSLLGRPRLTPRLTAALCLSGAAAAGVAAPPPASARTLAQTKASLASIVRSMPGSTSVYVREAATGTVLATRSQGVKRVPASVTKLFTTSTALLTDGPTTRLKTEIRHDGDIDEAGVLHGDLIVRGAGDPSLQLDQVAALAKAVTDAGITRLDGALRADLRNWSRDQGSPLTNGAYNREIGGRLGALVTLRGFGSATVTDPANQVLIRLRTALRADGLKGSVKLGGPVNPASESVVLGSAASPTMAQLAAATNAPSDNFYAEMLLRGVGARHGGAGTTQAGLAVERATLGPLGIHPTLADGSGLSRANRVAPTTIVKLLDTMAGRTEGAALRGGMALAGTTGTVAGRMRGTAAQGRCRVKTGTLSNVSALAGWCTTVGKRNVAFAVINNAVSVPVARRAQDRLAVAIASWSDPLTRDVVPASTPAPTTGITTPTTPASGAASGGAVTP